MPSQQGHTQISVADSLWQIVKSNSISIDSSFAVTINPITFYNNNQLVIGTSKGLMVYQAEFDKENALEPITKLKNIDLFFL